MTRRKWMIWLAAVVVAGGLVAGWLLSRPWAYDWREEIVTMEWHGATRRVIAGEFTVHAGKRLNPETRIRYVIPVGADGKPLPEARNNMVFYAPFNGEDGSAFFERLEWLRYFPGELGAAIFSLRVICDAQSVGEADYYILEEAGWHEIIINAREAIAARHGLKLNPLLVAGESSGGSLAERLAVGHPGLVGAAAWCGGSSYLTPAGPLDGAPALLAVNTWGCPGIERTEALRLACAEAGIAMTRAVTPPAWSAGRFDHHAAGAEAYRLIRQFLADAIRLRDGEIAAMPSPEFNRYWAELPHGAIAALEEGGAEEPAVWPVEEFDSLALVVNDIAVSGRPEVLDALYVLSRRRVLPLVLEADHLNDPARAVREALARILAAPEWRGLPLYVFGTGFGGQIAAAAARRNGDGRIAGCAVLDAEVESPFEELSLLETPGNVPLTLFYRGEAGAPEKWPPGSTVAILKPAEGGLVGVVRRTIPE